MNKKIHSSLCSLLLLLTITACMTANPEPLKNPDHIVYKPVHFSPALPERIVLDNGLVVYLLEDHELPLIEVSALIRTGAVYEPDNRGGLAALTGTVMRTGGTAHLSPEEVDRQLELMSASVSVSINSEEGSASLSVLKEDVDKGLDIFSQILTEPAFDLEKLTLAKKNMGEGLRRLTDNPQSFAFREFKKLLYAGNPRSNLPTLASIGKIERNDLIAFHRAFLHPDRTLFAISGDFTRDEMLKKIESKFGSWKPSAHTPPTIASPAPIAHLNMYHLQKQIPQSTIVMGHLAPQKSHPDYFPFQVLDFILGSGGFSSRLMTEIRSSRGLAYSVGSFYRADIDYGVSGAYCSTKSESAHQATSLMFDCLTSLKSGNISQEEVNLAKESLINSFIFSFTSSAQIVHQQMALEFERLPADFLRSIPEKLNAVTVEDVRRVAQAHLHPDQMIVLDIGDASKYDKPLPTWEWTSVQTVSSDILNTQ